MEFLAATNVTFTISLVCCLYMTGLIWFVQIVHYPLFAKIPSEVLTSTYASSHASRTSFVVIVPMIVELVTAIVLFLNPIAQMNSLQTICSLLLVIIIFLSTFLLQVPDHEEIQKHGLQKNISHLVTWNWLRTIAWSTRSVILISAL
jgi:hypothetical protein